MISPAIAQAELSASRRGATRGAKQMLDLSYQGANLNVEKLVEMKILVEGTGRLRNRVFVAREIVGLLN